MKKFVIKINSKYVCRFEESKIKATEGGGGWYQNATTHNLTIPILGKEPGLILGNMNLKSAIDRILKWEKITNKMKTMEIIESK